MLALIYKKPKKCLFFLGLIKPTLPQPDNKKIGYIGVRKSGTNSIPTLISVTLSASLFSNVRAQEYYRRRTKVVLGLLARVSSKSTTSARTGIPPPVRGDGRGVKIKENFSVDFGRAFLAYGTTSK